MCPSLSLSVCVCVCVKIVVSLRWYPDNWRQCGDLTISGHGSFLSLSHSLSHTHTHTCTHARTHTHTHTHTQSLPSTIQARLQKCKLFPYIRTSCKKPRIRQLPHGPLPSLLLPRDYICCSDLCCTPLSSTLLLVFARLSVTINIALTERQCLEQTLSTKLPATFVWLQFSD